MKDGSLHQYALLLAYDGSRFSGWQEQAPDRGITVAGELKRAFVKVFNHPVTLVGASRTDAGVHALGQVAAIRTTLDVEPEVLHFALQNQLPKDIYLRQVLRVSHAMHPQKNVAFKEYHYHVCRRWVLPHLAPYCARYPYAFDYQRLAWAFAQFEGTHDFWSFGSSSSDYAGVSTVCSIAHASCTRVRHSGIVRLVVRGDRFIHHMVRRMVGAALRYASYPDLHQAYINAAIAGRVDRMTIPTAPAHGLVLRKIIYQEGGGYDWGF